GMNEDFTGFGTKNTSAVYNFNSPSGIKAPASYARPHGNFGWAHKPPPFAGAYLLSGRSAFLDLLIDQMGGAVLAGVFLGGNARTNASVEVNGTVYWRCTVANNQQTRVGAWMHRDAAWVAICAPSSWRGADPRSYAIAVLQSTADCLLARWAHESNAFQQANKLWPVHNQYSTDSGSTGSWSTWQGNGYFGISALIGYLASGDADMKTVIENILAFWKNAADNKSAGADIYGSYKPHVIPPMTAANVAAWDDLQFVLGTSSGQLDESSMTRALLYFATALGFNIPAGMRAELDGWYTGTLADFTTAPTYCFTDNFGA
ncbi:MAG TPA: hypothetical protein VF175_04640, partial [Lacipirellula sp.]